MEASTVAAGPGRWNSRHAEQAPPPPAVRGLGYAAAAWSLGFAGVSVWLVAGMAGEPGKAGLVILSVVALVLKLAGAAVALAAVLHRPGGSDRPVRLLGMALWGAFGLLALYSAGNLFKTAGTVGGGRAGRGAAAARTAPGGGPGDPVPLGPAARLTPHEFPASRYAPRHRRLRS